MRISNRYSSFLLHVDMIISNRYSSLLLITCGYDYL
jgi:hypothetical protein